MRRKRKRLFKKRRTYTNKRRGFNRKRTGKKKANVSIVKTPFLSDLCMVKFHWTQAVKLTSTTQQTSFVVPYRLNGAIDPECSALIGNGQPLGWATYVDQYKIYRCFGSKVKISFINEGTHSVCVGWVPMVDLPFFLANTTTRGMIAQRYAKYVMVAPTGGQNRGVVKHYMTTSKMFSGREVKTDMDFTGTMTPNQTFQTITNLPIHQAYWALIGFCPDTASAVSVNAIIDIKYYCRLEQPRQPTYADDQNITNIDDHEPQPVPNDTDNIVIADP